MRVSCIPTSTSGARVNILYLQ
uniref:Uncharacterized protein n=1 Tax=mine drainage metagenome TaxID=410659 RepID=E6QM88_9ZZZZ